MARQLAASIQRGRELFLDQTAGCVKCHAQNGTGTGPQIPIDYDDWTKEWTQQIQIDYNDTDELLPFFARGGMKPQPIPPRNLVEVKLPWWPRPESRLSPNVAR